ILVRRAPPSLLVPQHSWVGTGPCCIVKAQGGLCLVLARDWSKQCIFPGRTTSEAAENPLLPVRTVQFHALGLRFGLQDGGKRQPASPAVRFPAGLHSSQVPQPLDRSRGKPRLQIRIREKDPGQGYQTRQDVAGYMGWPLVQPKALPNWSKFCTEPFTRQRPGEWGSTSAAWRADCSVWFWHH